MKMTDWALIGAGAVGLLYLSGRIRTPSTPFSPNTPTSPDYGGGVAANIAAGASEEVGAVIANIPIAFLGGAVSAGAQSAQSVGQGWADIAYSNIPGIAPAANWFFPLQDSPTPANNYTPAPVYPIITPAADAVGSFVNGLYQFGYDAGVNTRVGIFEVFGI